MGQGTKIEWADNTFNPWRGCSKVSEAGRLLDGRTWDEAPK